MIRFGLAVAALLATAACGPPGHGAGVPPEGTTEATPEDSVGTGRATAAAAAAWSPAPPLPRPVANNAVAGLDTPAGPAVFSLLGIDTTKIWSGVTNWAFRWIVGDGAWTEIAPVPGPGRLAGTAQAVGDHLYLFGGYTVAEDGSEASLPNVDVYDPARDVWSTAAPMPVPVDDAVSGVWRDSLIVIVSGWHDRDNVPDVQIYDPARDAWRVGSPIPGPPVFGHTGSVAGDVVLYRDGARVRAERPRFVLAPSAWRGEIDPSEPTTIEWGARPEPGPALYRAAAVALGDWIVFAGGTDNPYNYDGTGYDGRLAEPRSDVWAYHVVRDLWVRGPSLPVPSMDHRALAVAGGRVVLAGGMDAGRRVVDRVLTIDAGALEAALEAAPVLVF